MKLKFSEKDKEIFKDIRRMKDESNKINQILNSDDWRIDLLKQDLRKRKRNKINTLPNLIYNQGQKMPFKTTSNSPFKYNEKKKDLNNLMSKTVYSNSTRIKKPNKPPFNKNQTRTFFDNDNCTYDYFLHLEKMKRINKLSQMNSIIGEKKEIDYKRMPLNYKNLEKDFEYIHGQLYDDYDKLERYKKLDDILIGDNGFQPYETKNVWRPLKIRDYYLKKSLIFHKMKSQYMYRNNNNNEYDIMKNYINKIESGNN